MAREYSIVVRGALFIASVLITSGIGIWYLGDNLSIPAQLLSWEGAKFAATVIVFFSAIYILGSILWEMLKFFMKKSKK